MSACREEMGVGQLEHLPFHIFSARSNEKGDKDKEAERKKHHVRGLGEGCRVEGEKKRG